MQRCRKKRRMQKEAQKAKLANDAKEARMRKLQEGKGCKRC